MSDVNEIQSVLRDLLKDGRIADTLDHFDSYLKEKSITDRHISDGLITISASYRGLVQLQIKGTIEYETYSLERKKLVDRLLILIRDIPFLKPKNTKGAESSQALLAIESSQKKDIVNIREGLISADNIIIELFEQVNQKEKELILVRSDSQIAVLKREIELLNRRIEREEQKYIELKEKYEKIKEEQARVELLTVELDAMKRQIDLKNEHIRVLEERFVYSDKLLKQREIEINDLKEKVFQATEKGFLISKAVVYTVAFMFVGIMIFLLSIIINM